jgi:hypothetical protein
MKQTKTIAWAIFEAGRPGNVVRSGEGIATLEFDQSLYISKLNFLREIKLSDNETLHVIFNMKGSNEARSEAQDPSSKPE